MELLPAPAEGRLGATPLPRGGCEFRVWAPRAEALELVLADTKQSAPMPAAGDGYFACRLARLKRNGRYYYRFPDGRLRPDPASRCQPEGVHGPSAAIFLDFPWRDKGWSGRKLSELVFYELHVGTFTPRGSFDAIIPRLGELRRLGITAIELMPVAQFPGRRNWGYDGVFPYAPQLSYGGARGLMRLVNGAHRAGLAVFLDVVYNHLGPEGNYLVDFGPYFTAHYQTPWGAALNYDGEESDEVRRYFIGNALEWVRDYHFDGLRLDAIHGIMDNSASPFLAELAEALQAEAGRLGRPVHVIVESNLNDIRVLRPRAQGGYGMDAQWNDDFHHALHTALTPERDGYYRDFSGAGDLGRALEEGFVYQGQFSAYRRRRHGNRSREITPQSFVIFAQNHDQTGNRAGGERLSALTSLEGLKLAAVTLLTAPQLPLLFMGEEYGEAAPFLYFIEHGDAALVEAVRRGRREEFAAFGWKQPPDPQSDSTFAASRLRWEQRRREPHRTLLEFYGELLRLRRRHPSLVAGGQAQCRLLNPELLLIERHPPRGSAAPRALLLLNFGSEACRLAFPRPGDYRLLLASSKRRWHGPGDSLPPRIHHSRARLELPAGSAAIYIAENRGRK